MEDKNVRLWHGAQPVIGGVVGVGIFALPYVFSRAGYIVGFLELLIVAVIALVTFFMYSDLLAARKGHVRFVTVAEEELGLAGKIVAAIAFFGGLWGAMLAYILVGGSLAANIFVPLFGGDDTLYQTLFWFTSSLTMIGGSLFVRRLQGYLIPVFFTLIAALVLFALPSMRFDHFTTVHPENAMVPVGALLFAMSGFASVAEAKDALGRAQSLLHPSLALATFLIVCIYVLFTLAIVGMTGPSTTEHALDGLRFLVSPLFVLLVSIAGLCTIFTAYMSVGNVVLTTLLYDFKGRFVSSWLLAVLVPFVIFLAGSRNFLDVVSFTGGILGALSGIVLVLAYERARLAAHLPKRALALPQVLVGLSFLAFVVMMFMTIADLA